MSRTLLRVHLPMLLVLLAMASTTFAKRPNVVFVITDDQGYGDLACHGNPVIKTPNVDALAKQSAALSNYHVAPTCSPSRAALLTGHWTNRTGVWHTINGRSMLRENEVTLGQLFQDAGYKTAMFGKWHLGDNYPYRAEDRGFGEVYRHGGGGVGQTPDVWDNAYFDGSYFHNGSIEPATGFCTDVFFEQAQKFIRKCAKADEPFLAYISTNAPHGPLHAPQKYLDMYKDQSPGIASFFGMITNIDDNVGTTRKLLAELGIEDDTIFVFTTDNGTASGANIFNAGMRGKKGSEYDGGHRVPFFIHWPNGKLRHGETIPTLSHAVDIVPTLLDLVGIDQPTNIKFDGVSLRALLDSSITVRWADRMLITDSQRVRDPIKWRKSAVMSQRWRLVNGVELYDIQNDPGQESDVAKQHPDQLKRMRDFYEAWWSELEPTFAQTTEIHLGHPDHVTVSMTAHDWIADGSPPWNQSQIREGSVFGPRAVKRRTDRNGKPPKHDGHWAIKVLEGGKYRVTMRRWPAEANHPIASGLPAGSNVPGASKAYRTKVGTAIAINAASIRVNDEEVANGPVPAGATEVAFTVNLAAGSQQLSPVFITDAGEVGAYYAIVTKLE